MPVDNIFSIHMPTLSSFAASSSHAAKENAEKIDTLSLEMFMLSDIKEGLGWHSNLFLDFRSRKRRNKQETKNLECEPFCWLGINQMWCGAVVNDKTHEHHPTRQILYLFHVDVEH